MKKDFRTKLFVALILIFLIILLHFSGLDTIFLKYLNENKEYWKEIVNKNYFMSVFSFLIFYIFANIFLIIVTLPLTMIAGFLFGPIAGTIYSVLGSTIGSTLVFLVFKHLVGKLFQEKYSEKIANFNANIQKYGSIYLLILRLNLITPFFLVSILAAFTNISLFTFVWTTFLGILPATAIYAFAGKQLGSIDSFYDIFTWPILLSYLLIIILVLMPLIIKKYKSKK